MALQVRTWHVFSILASCVIVGMLFLYSQENYKESVIRRQMSMKRLIKKSGQGDDTDKKENQAKTIAKRPSADSLSMGVNFYLLADSIDYTTAKKRGLDQLSLQSEPWISSEDIVMYDVSGSCLYLKRDFERPVKQIDIRGTPFVITADGQPCRLGAFWTFGSSFSTPENASVIHTPVGSDCKDLLSIELLSSQWNGNAGEDETDRLITDALKREGKLHSGITCSLDDVEVISNKEHSRVRYTYTLKNVDSDDLYVLDPEKMHLDDFHSLQNGIVVIYGADDHHYPVYQPDDKKYVRSVPWNQISPDWFVLLRSGQSMTRTVELANVYPSIKAGRYECLFGFGSPEFSHGATGAVTKEQRLRKDGRIWIGQLHLKSFINIE